MPPGLLSLAGFLTLVVGVVVGVYLLAGPGWAFIAGGLLGAAALVAADGLRDDSGRGGRRG